MAHFLPPLILFGLLLTSVDLLGLLVRSISEIYGSGSPKIRKNLTFHSVLQHRPITSWLVKISWFVYYIIAPVLFNKTFLLAIPYRLQKALISLTQLGVYPCSSEFNVQLWLCLSWLLSHWGGVKITIGRRFVFFGWFCFFLIARCFSYLFY